MKWFRSGDIRFLAFSVGLAVASAGLSLARADEIADRTCARALLQKDFTDRLSSVESHYSHESPWEARAAYLESDPQRWKEYLWARYSPFLRLYTQYPVELNRMMERITSAGKGVSGSLGELQIAEKYLLDPNVSRVQWIEESKVSGQMSPDFKIYYVDGGAKIVEVKTRSPEELPNADSFEAHLTKSNLQVRDYKAAHPEARFLRAELEVVLSFTETDRLNEAQKQKISRLAEAAFMQTQWLTRMTLNFNNQPFFRINLRIKNGERSARATYLRRPSNR